MRSRIAVALIALSLGALAHGSGANAPAKTEFVGSLRWQSDAEKFGGFSGLELSDDGMGFTTVSDGGILAQGRFERDPVSGVMTGVSAFEPLPLLAVNGDELVEIWDDAECLAVAPDGAIFVSFEGIHRVWRYDVAGGVATQIPQHHDFEHMQNNSALEALAIDGDGSLFTLPERSGVLSRPFPVYRFRDGVWQQPFAIRRRPPFLMVGADFGPDGKLYLLERHLSGLFGFRTRVRRFSVGEDGVSQEETLVSSTTGQFDNLEGISVWRDSAGDIRITMISDDNFRAFQRTEFVEFRVTE
ncbi:MAG: esterase-like activity of phytase family protein [Paracoccaceae bacterium]